MAIGAPFAYTPLEEILRRAESETRSLVILLDHVSDPGNLGAVIRSAEVAGALGVVVPKARAAGVTPAVYKASAGAVAHAAVAQVPNLVAALERLKEAGFWVLGASEHAHDDLWDASMAEKLALVLGAEGAGLARLTERTCDLVVRIPAAGCVASLNVAQAATVFAFEWMRRGRDAG